MATELEARTAIRKLTKKFNEVKDSTDLSFADKSAKLDKIHTDLQAHSQVLTLAEKSRLIAAGIAAAGADTDVDGVLQKDTDLAARLAAGRRSLGEQLAGSKEFEEFRAARKAGNAHYSTTVEIGTKVNTIPVNEGSTLVQDVLQGQGGAAVYPNFLPGIVQQRFQPLTVADLFSQGSTDSPIIVYVQEGQNQAGGTVANGWQTDTTNLANSGAAAAAGVAESGQYQPSVDDIFRVVEQVGKVAHFTKVTDEMIQDAPQFASYINGRMTFGVRLREQLDLLNGTGYPSITGVLQRTNKQNAVAAGAITTDVTPLIESIFQQVTNIRWNAFVEPDCIVMNPTDWQLIRLGKDANGQYYGGGPFTGAYGQGGITSTTTADLWGFRVLVTPAIAPGTTLVGGFEECAQIFRRAGIVVEMANQDATNFQLGLVSIRATERLGLAVYRPGGFGTVTHT